MAKRKDTIAIENLLINDTKEKRIYGCEEVTIGFWRSGGGNEHVDFMTMDSKDIFRCYEIKVTMSDLKSHAKKSFYGHYNYLVVTEDLYRQIVESDIDLEQYGIPNWVGITAANIDENGITHSRFYVWNMKRKAKRQDIDEERQSMLKSSLVRTMYYKMTKYRSESDGTAIKEARKEANEYKKLYEQDRERIKNASNAIFKMKHMFFKKYGYRMHIHLDIEPTDWFVEIDHLINYVVHKNRTNRR